MKRIWARKWVRVLVFHVLGIAGIALFMIMLGRVFGGICPTNTFFGICCPYCGMTRAHFAALRGDFATAFSYHPVFFLGIPFLWMLFHSHLFTKRWQKVLWGILVGLMGTALGVTYIIRICLFGFDFA